MKKSFIFGLFATTIGAVAAGLVISNSGVAIGGFAGGDSQAIWKHYAQKDATATEKGIREYWIECDGDYQFTAPQGVTVVEGTAYDTSEFTQDDPRWLTYVSGSVFYNMTTSAYDFCEVGTALDGYTPVSEVDKTVAGSKLNAVYVKTGAPTLMVEQLTVTDTIKTANDWVNKLDASTKDLIGYYAVTNNINSNIYCVSSDVDLKDNTTSVKVTIDGRNHTVAGLFSRAKHAGIFGSCGLGGDADENIVMKDLTISLYGDASGYGMFGYQGAIGATDSILLENVKITSRAANTSGVIAGTTAGERIKYKNCTINIAFENNTLYYTSYGSFTINKVFTNTTIVIDTANDTKTVPNAIKNGNMANEREGLVSKVAGVTFVQKAA